MTKICFVIQNETFLKDVRVLNEVNIIKDHFKKIFVVSPIFDSEPENKPNQKIYIFYYKIPRAKQGVTEYIKEYLISSLKILFLNLKTFLKGARIYHLANPPDFLILLTFPLKFFGIKIIYDQHDISPELFEVKFGKQNSLKKALKILEKLSAKLADKIIVPNELYKRNLIQSHKISPQKIHILRPIVNFPEKFKDLKNLKKGKFIVGYVGTINKTDNVELILKIAEILKSQKDIEFWIIGTGDDIKRLEAIKKNKNLKNVNFLGYIPHDKIHQYIDIFDVAINPEYPNKFADKSTMIKVAEYLWLGKVVIQYPREEALKLYKNCSFFAKDEKDFVEIIINLKKDKKLKEDIEKKALKRGRELFSFEKQRKELLKIYQNLTGRRLL